MLRISKILFSFLLLTFITTSAHADSNWVQSENIRARFVDNYGKFGVEIETRQGWHTYYKVPGDAGIPTVFDFTGSTNFRDPQVTFPAYKVIEEYGFKTNAYEGLTYFPVKADASDGAHINLAVSGAVCAEICIPFDIKISYDPVLPNKEASTGEQENSLIYILFLALVAGFILNIMPCVLPVLSLKVLSVLKQTGKQKKHARINFLATSAGIIVSFLALAGLTVALKQAGMAVGWGLHFQSPIFVGVLMLITLAFAISLFGFFHLSPPSWLSGTGSGKDSLTGNFFSGVIATLLGTSCTAPVLVTAVGYALAGSSFMIFLIFTIMGIGMALPFLLFALRPSLINFLPKPGKWMVKIKYLMGAFLLATTIWLGYVLVVQLSADRMQEQGWIKFDEEQVQELVEDGSVVFVDVTAEWCVNCKANKVRVLDTESMKAFFAKNDVILMQADLTKPSSVILKYLRSKNRYGIPVNVVYGPNAKDGILLDSFLTEGTVENAITSAKAN